MKTLAIKLTLIGFLSALLISQSVADNNDSTALVMIDSLIASPNPFCAGESVQLIAYVSGGSGVYTYFWTSIPVGQIYSMPTPVVNLLQTTSYILTVNDGLNPPVSDTITVNLTNNVVTGGVIGNNQTICEGADPAPFVIITAAAGSGVLSYMWMVAANPGGPWSYIPGATAATFDPPALTQTMYYRRITTSTLGNCTITAFSNELQIFVNSVSGGMIGSDQTICSGGDPAMIVNIGSGSGNGTLTYYWQLSHIGATGPYSNIATGTSLIYDPPVTTTNTWFRRIVISTLNGVVCSSVSNTVAITVLPLPAAPGSITGPTQVCQGQTSVVYTVAPIQYTTSYIWTVPVGATINNGQGTNAITVNIGIQTISGVISVRGSNSCGYGPVSNLSVSIHPLPYAPGTITGPTEVCQGQNTCLYTVPFTPNATSYVWTVPVGATTGWAFTNAVTVNFGPNASSGLITVRGVNACGDGPSSSLYVTVHPCSTVSGTLNYDNLSATPMGNTPIKLNTTGGTYKTTVTDQSGNFAFNNVFPGTYTVQPIISKASGGINAVDAMFALQEFVNTGTLQGLKLLAADVDSSGYINAVDAMLIAKRFVGMISTFTAGDWYSETAVIQASQGNSLTALLKCICYGDVDGSFIPVAK